MEAVTSPKRKLTREEKRSRDEKYRVDVATFGDVLKKLTTMYTALTSLHSAMGQAGKGAYLAFKNPANKEQAIPFNRKHLAAADAMFKNQLKDLKNFLRVSKTKNRPPVAPETLSSVYTPVYAGDALKYWFSATQNFGPLSPLTAAQTGQVGQLFMDAMPLLKQGLFLRNGLTMLFYIYAHVNGLQNEENAQFSRFDDVMMKAFGGEIPATYYSYDDPSKPGKKAKMLMAQAVLPVEQGGRGLARPLNTVENIKALYPQGKVNKKGQDVTFDTKALSGFYFQIIGSLNYYSRDFVSKDPAFVEVAKIFDSAEGKAALLEEHATIKKVGEEWKTLLEPSRKAKRDANKKAKDAVKKAAKAASKSQ